MYEMYCSNRECSQYGHKDTYLVKNNKQRVNCGKCKSELERGISSFNVGGGKSSERIVPQQLGEEHTTFEAPCGQKFDLTIQHGNFARVNKHSSSLN